MFKPAHAPPTAVGEVSVSRARIPRLVNALFCAVNAGTAPAPLGPVTSTLPAASTSCQRYCSAAACAAGRMVVSLVVRAAAVKVMLPLDGAVATDAGNGRTEYPAARMPIGKSDNDLSDGDVPVYGP